MNNKKTIKEFAAEVGISKSKMNYQVSKLNNESIIKINGIKYLTIAAQKEIKESISMKSNEKLNSNSNIFKYQIRQLENQVLSKDEQINKLHDLLDQQQQLQLKTQQMLEEKTSLLELKNDELNQLHEKKWWQFWK